MATAVIGANLEFGNSSALWATYYRKLGMKSQSNPRKMPNKRNNAADAGATFPRQICICSKTSATAPTTNTAADGPTGLGDICVHFATTTVVASLAKIAVADIDIYRCSAYTDENTFTWTKIVD
jgi:hypothetical protein